MSAPWLADVLRAAGCAVDESRVPDWRNRGHNDGPFAPIGVMGHHTAGGAGDLPSLGIVRDGRADLAGPLANLMLSRSGVWVPIAAGRCWHAGGADNPGRWPWVPGGDGNGYLIGIEAESSGVGDWTPEQIAAYPHGVAALLAHMGAGPDRFLGHLEWAPSRKIDPAGWPGGMNAFRSTIAQGAFDMPLTDQDVAKIMDWPFGPLLPGGPDLSFGQFLKAIPDFLQNATGGDLRNILANEEADGKKLDALASKVGGGQPVNVDAGAVAAALASNTAFLAALAKAVNDDAAKRLAS